jgi:hypothetical protein
MESNGQYWSRSKFNGGYLFVKIADPFYYSDQTVDYQVWMNKSHEIRDQRLYLFSWDEEQLDPSIDKKFVRMKNASK